MGCLKRHKLLQKSGRDQIPWRDPPFTLWLRGKNQEIFRFNARAVIKAVLSLLNEWSQGHLPRLRDARSLRREVTEWIYSLESDSDVKELSVRLSSEWAEYAGFCPLLNPRGSGVGVKTVDSWVLGEWLGWKVWGGDEVSTRLFWTLVSSQNFTDINGC